VRNEHDDALEPSVERIGGRGGLATNRGTEIAPVEGPTPPAVRARISLDGGAL
jgi:hypothetical protein